MAQVNFDPEALIRLLDLIGVGPNAKRQKRLRGAFGELAAPIPETQGPPSIEQTPTSLNPFGMGEVGFNVPTQKPPSPLDPQEVQNRTLQMISKIVGMGGSPDEAVKLGIATGKIKDPIADRQLKIQEAITKRETDKQKADIEFKTNKEKRVDERFDRLMEFKEKALKQTGALANNRNASARENALRRLYGEYKIKRASFVSENSFVDPKTGNIISVKDASQFPDYTFDEFKKEFQAGDVSTGNVGKTREERAAELKAQIAAKKITPEAALNTLNKEYPENNAK